MRSGVCAFALVERLRIPSVSELNRNAHRLFHFQNKAALFESGPTASGTLVLRGDGEIPTIQSRRDGDKDPKWKAAGKPSDGRFLIFSEPFHPFYSKLRVPSSVERISADE
jgi:hypothetical protein